MSVELVREAIARVFDTRNEAHSEHWATNSYAKHMALGDFYDGVIDKIDAFVESYQGQFGLIGKGEAEEESPDSEQEDIIACLRDTSDWLTANMEQICMGDQTLMNLLQEVVHVYLVTLYKLENLK